MSLSNRDRFLSSSEMLKGLSEIYFEEVVEEAVMTDLLKNIDGDRISAELRRFKSLFLIDPGGFTFFDTNLTTESNSKKLAESKSINSKEPKDSNDQKDSKDSIDSVIPKRLRDSIERYLKTQMVGHGPATHIKRIVDVRKLSYKALFDLRVMIIERIPASAFNNPAVSGWLFWIVADASGAGVIAIVPDHVSPQIFGGNLPTHGMKNQVIVNTVNDRFPIGSIVDLIALRVTSYFGIIMFVQSRKGQILKRGRYTLRHSLAFTNSTPD